MRKITLAEMAPHVHKFLPRENKVDKLSKWLISWITLALKNNKVKPFDLLPSKGEIACHVGVSQGTVQSAFRIVEDAGYIESKQRIGTYIKDRSHKQIEKLTSKKDMAVDTIKEYMLANDYKIGDTLISTRKLSKITGISSTTIRIAISELILQGILEKKNNKFVLTGRSYRTSGIKATTLVEKITVRMKDYLSKEFEHGAKIPPVNVLAEKFHVSTKTIHNAVKKLAKEGFLYSRRGQYGTIIVKESDIGSSVRYSYEKIENLLRQRITTELKIGDKLPSIKKLSEEYSVSEKSIKHALDNLADEGFLTFERGRYGGTFITDIPQESNKTYTWLALDKNYVEDN
ncbi:MAG: GntR family transcriptional regulator [bacterium]|nr:GntR family transcriptional regulator [bacterium]